MSKNTRTNGSSIAAFTGGFVASLDARERDVIKSRYGLDGGEPATLQAIGDRLHVTRERVRQIEAGALSTLRKRADQSYLPRFVEAAVSSLKGLGGAARENLFIADIRRSLFDRSPEAVFTNSAKFLLELSGKMSFHKDNGGDWHPYWYLTDSDRRRAQGFISQLASALRTKRDDVVNGNRFQTVFAQVIKAAKLSDDVARNYLALSTHFVEGPFNDVGLAEWPEVNPRTARDWAYAILKREQKPLHFTDLAKLVSEHREDKRTNVQTIHNELIKDNRFVLVGRGLYSLRELGFIPGTAREIITHLLKEHGPLKAQEVVSKVREQRMLKDATILINLQNRKHFASLPDGRYQLREA